MGRPTSGWTRSGKVSSVSATVQTTQSRGPSLAPGARVVAAALLLLLGTGCGDSLLGSFGLSNSLGIGLELPVDPAWTMRWLGGPGAPTVGSCDALAADAGDTPEGFEMAGPTPLPTQLATIEGDGFTWSLAIPLVNDGSTVIATASAPLDGVWGVAPFHALLVATGDLDALEQELQIDSLDGTPLVAGGQWVEIFLETATPSDLVGAIATVDQAIEFTSGDGALYVEPLDAEGVHADVLALANGEDPLGGLDLPECD